MKPVTKSKISAFVVVLLLFGCSLYWLISGVIVLNRSFSEKNLFEITPSNAKKGTYVEGDITSCFGAYLEMEHKINGVIKIGSEKYYLVPYSNHLIFTKVAKKDYEKYNDLSNPGDVRKPLKCEGILREYDSRLRSNLDIDSLMKDSEQTSSDEMFVPYYIDTTAKSYAVIKIVEGLIFIILITIPLLVSRIKGSIRGRLAKYGFISYFVLFFIGAGIFLSKMYVLFW